MHWIWLAALIVFAILEVSTSALVSVWFMGGSLVALISTLLGAPVWLQLVLFFAVSAVLLLLLRPLARKYLTPRKTATNARSNIGKTAIVTEPIDNLKGTGAVRIAGVRWSARSTDDSVLEEGTEVLVKEIQGVKVCVEKTEKTEEVSS